MRDSGKREISRKSPASPQPPSLALSFPSLRADVVSFDILAGGPPDQVTRDSAEMAAIGPLVFCTDCGNLLEPNTGRKTYIQCDLCGAQNKGEWIFTFSVRTQDSSDPSCKTLHLKLS